MRIIKTILCLCSALLTMIWMTKRKKNVNSSDNLSKNLKNKQTNLIDEFCDIFVWVLNFILLAPKKTWDDHSVHIKQANRVTMKGLKVSTEKNSWASSHSLEYHRKYLYYLSTMNNLSWRSLTSFTSFSMTLLTSAQQQQHNKARCCFFWKSTIFLSFRCAVIVMIYYHRHLSKHIINFYWLHPFL